MKRLVYAIFIILYLAVTFFGLGPVLLADGSMRERLFTLGAVVLLYVALTVLLRHFRKRDWEK